jgi:hypothetical protein
MWPREAVEHKLPTLSRLNRAVHVERELIAWKLDEVDVRVRAGRLVLDPGLAHPNVETATALVHELGHARPDLNPRR